MERKLASIRRISDINSIEGSDFLDMVSVDGWKVVSQKTNGFKPNDLVVYFEVDSVLPETETFEFLRDRCYVSEKSSINGAGFRLKTIKLRGQISQGLILPLNIVFNNEIDFVEGEDVTDLLGVVKYEKPVPAHLAGKVRGNFPSFLRKTDQERIQNCYRTLQNKWLNHFWEVSIKLDGSSFTAYYNAEEDRFGVCSRNLDLAESGENAFWQVARKYGLETKMREHGISIAIQGELIGPGIQGNPEGLTELDMYVFDIFDIQAQKYFASFERQLLTEYFGLNHVPVIDIVQLHECKLEDILEFADGPSLYAKRREGIVFKSLDDPNVSWKAISNQWLLKNEG